MICLKNVADWTILIWNGTENTSMRFAKNYKTVLTCFFILLKTKVKLFFQIFDAF